MTWLDQPQPIGSAPFQLSAATRRLTKSGEVALVPEVGGNIWAVFYRGDWYGAIQGSRAGVAAVAGSALSKLIVH